MSATIAHSVRPEFTAAARAAFEVAREQLASAISWPVILEYGETEDDAEHWAAFGVADLPPGSFGRPGLLVSIVTGQDVPGFAVILSADGRAVVCSVTAAEHLTAALRIATAEAAQRFAELTEGAFA